MTEKSMVHHASERVLLKMLDRAYESVEEKVRRIRAYYYLRRWRDRLAFFCLGVTFMLLMLLLGHLS